MLLRESLTDKDIPRRDKVREAVIKQFEKEFFLLKDELSVKSPFTFSITSTDRYCRILSGV